ncbi:MAG: hypothetical protein K8R56_07215 [Candidatus Eisenbacteria bacterium]|nr:hypothetical protein [Candidatus Eisenbacteria bacterium]
MTPQVPSTAGLCATCAHARAVVTPRSRFLLCEKSREDAQFARYPRLPVIACAGYEPRAQGPSDTSREPGEGSTEK